MGDFLVQIIMLLIGGIISVGGAILNDDWKRVATIILGGGLAVVAIFWVGLRIGEERSPYNVENIEDVPAVVANSNDEVSELTNLPQTTLTVDSTPALQQSENSQDVSIESDSGSQNVVASGNNVEVVINEPNPTDIPSSTPIATNTPTPTATNTPTPTVTPTITPFPLESQVKGWWLFNRFADGSTELSGEFASGRWHKFSYTSIEFFTGRSVLEQCWTFEEENIHESGDPVVQSNCDQGPYVFVEENLIEIIGVDDNGREVYLYASVAIEGNELTLSLPNESPSI